MVSTILARSRASICVKPSSAPGRSCKGYADAQQPAVLDQAALDDLGQQRHVDVAARDQHHGAAMAQVGLGLKQRRQCRRARALGQRLLLLQQHENGAGDLLVVHGDNLVHVAGDQRQGQVAGAAHGDAVGDGGLGVDGDRSAGLAGAQHRGQLLRLDADHANLGVGLFERAGDAADEPAAADGNDHGFQVGNLFQQFQADGALAGDDLRVVEGMDEGAALFERGGAGPRRRLRRSWRRAG